MGTGQTILTLCAIILFLLTSLNINRSILQTTKTTVDQQATINAINYGQSLIETLYSHPGDLASFQITYGQYNDVNNPENRLTHISETGEELAATIDISPKSNLAHNVPGVIATVTVFELIEDEIEQKAVYYAALTLE